MSTLNPQFRYVRYRDFDRMRHADALIKWLEARAQQAQLRDPKTARNMWNTAVIRGRYTAEQIDVFSPMQQTVQAVLVQDGQTVRVGTKPVISAMPPINSVGTNPWIWIKPGSGNQLIPNTGDLLKFEMTLQLQETDIGNTVRLNYNVSNGIEEPSGYSSAALTIVDWRTP